MRVIAIVSVIVIAGVIVTLAACRPELLADNEFLKDFVKSQVLNILAVIMTISITSIATIHIWFNELETKNEGRVFGKARRELNDSAFYLIGFFLLELFILIMRSAVGDSNKTAASLFNGATIIITLCSVITLIDIVSVVKTLTPED